MSYSLQTSPKVSAESFHRAFAAFYQFRGKRIFDVVVGGTMLVLAAPVILILMAVVAMDGGPAIFAQPRVGRGGRVFPCYKLRTMVPNAAERLATILASDPKARAEWERDHKLAVDPRITPIGHFLRRTSLDELPQLWNVVTGEMSLVGPRPVTRVEMHRYASDASIYKSVRPGLTGLWQLQGRGRDVTYDERVAMDVLYAHTISLAEDIRIMLGTAAVVVRRTGR
ncbi:MAG: sugar transferase [Pseudomonadota bacterium]